MRCACNRRAARPSIQVGADRLSNRSPKSWIISITYEIAWKTSGKGLTDRTSSNPKVLRKSSAHGMYLDVPALMPLPKQLGHTARALHDKVTTWCSRQVFP